MMSSSKFNVSDFPLLKRRINDKRLVYLDSAATSLKPQSVIDKIYDYYTKYTANIFRGIYKISEDATAEYEAVRAKVARFINAPSPDEIVFTRNTTESINIVASGMKKSDEVVASIMEHHSNFVPWQQLAALTVWKLGKEGRLNVHDLNHLITRKTKVLAITAVSNVLGLIAPISQICQIVKKLNPDCLVLVDAAQAAPHMPINVQEWGADFVAFSSHKMLGPTGVGVLWGKMEHLEKMSPYQYGGEMIREVHVDKTIFAKPPHKFEAGTPHIAGVIGLGSAIDYLESLGMDTVRAHEVEITTYALKQLKQFGNVSMYGPQNRGGVIAFTMKGVHAHDIAQVLDEDNICIRAGHHCAMPLHEYLNLPATARASFYVYTAKEDIDMLIVGLEKVKRLFS